MTDDILYVILSEKGTSVSECYAGWTNFRPKAELIAETLPGTVHETTREGINKIEKAVQLEAQYLETLRTGLARKTRGVAA